jgi:Zn-dependent M28 family amino/carboxypeptidase
MRSILCSLVALIVATPTLAQTAPQISVETLKSVTQELSSDGYEGRAPTTAGEKKTIDYLVKRFQAAGLKPGNKGQWTQNVPMVEITATDVSPFIVTGGKAPVTFNYRTDIVAGTYRVVSKVALKNSDLVFVGYGINAPEKGWNDYAGLDVKGKTVVILVNDPDWQTKEAGVQAGPFEGRAMTYYGRWTYKFEEAARQGAAGAIIVHETEPAAYGWSVVQSSWTGAQYGLDVPNNHMDQSEMVGWIQLGKAKELFAAAGKNFDQLSAAAKQKGFRAVPLGLKLSGSFSNDFKRSMSKNVVGLLPGTTAPDEVVLYSAHWDHLGRCDAVDGDDICNGAADNATGTAALVAMAEAYRAAGPTRRSVAFVAVTEESGLLGSQYYAANPAFPIGKTVGGVNMDVLNLIGPTKDFEIVGAGKSELEDMVRPLLAAQGRRVSPEATPESGGYYRSDHFSFAKLGVPMLSAGSGEDLVNGGVLAGKAAAKDYNVNRYHGPKDEYDPNWNWDGAVQDLTIYYQLGRELADSDVWPNWYPTAEFKAIRDKSRQEVK